MNTPESTHPAAASARRYLDAFPGERLDRYEGYFRETALRNGEMGARCFQALQVLRVKAPMTDLEVLGLAWVIRSIEGQLADAARKDARSAQAPVSGSNPGEGSPNG